MRRDPTAKNVILLALCQALGMSCSALIITVTALIGNELAPDRSLVTLPLALLVCVLLATVNQWSRALIFYVVDFSSGASNAFEFINVDLGFDQAQYGLLASIAFSALFAGASLLALATAVIAMRGSYGP